MNHVFLRGQRVKLDDQLLLGQGGEARVFAHATLDLALKVFHTESIPSAQSARLAALRVEKLRVLVDKPLPLVVTPQELLFDKDGAVVGYAMKKVSGAHDIALLAKKSLRAGWDNERILALFRVLADALTAIHRADVVVGDCNDGNIIVTDREAYFIDADSMQVGSLPCPVAHERFLDPKLYGKNLVDGACFDAGSDAFALRVLLLDRKSVV